MKLRRGVKVLAQRHDWDCGIASLAMLLGFAYGDVAQVARALWGQVPPCRRGLVIRHMEALAAELGRELRRVYRRRGYLEGATGILGVNGGQMCWAGHWVVLKAGAVIDPDDGSVWSVDDYMKRHKSRPGTLLVEEC